MDPRRVESGIVPFEYNHNLFGGGGLGGWGGPTPKRLFGVFAKEGTSQHHSQYATDTRMPIVTSCYVIRQNMD